MKTKSYFLMIFLILIFSCEEKEKPGLGIGKVTITEIELVESLNPSAKSQASVQWKHIFSNPLQVTFVESGTGETFHISINPNDFNQPYSINLPFGNYSYSGSSAGENISSTLPLIIAGQIVVDNASETLVLPGKSDFGLVTLSKANLSNAPKILDPLIGTLSISSDFYYTYVKGGLLLKTELSLINGKSFRLGVNSIDYFHRQFQVKASPTDPQDVFQPVDFDVNNFQINLGVNGLPETLSPYNLIELPTSQNESSGIQWIQGRLFSINDEENLAEIYELDSQTGALLRTVKVTNGTNVDWEDLAASSTHLYVGDMGNNRGRRTNLRVLKIPVSSILSQSEVSAEFIEFSYPDQNDFSGVNSNHNFDCEAMLFLDNQLHLFSKNYGDGRSKHYTLPVTPGTHRAILLESFDAKGLITGADVSADGKNVVLLGYENRGTSSRSFLWTFGSVSSSMFSGTGNQFFLGSPAVLSQTEGITIDSQLELKIAGEQINLSGLTVPPKMFELDLVGIFTP